MLRLAGAPPSVAPNAARLAAALVGPDCLRLVGHLPDGGDVDGDRIAISRDSAERMNFAVARMLARRELRRRGAWDDQSERRLGAFLVAPTPVVEAVLSVEGADVPELASTCVITQTCAAMRFVEVGALDGAVITPHRVYRPGRLLRWVSDDQARAIARSRRQPSVRRVAITDEPGRVALFSASVRPPT